MFKLGLWRLFHVEALHSTNRLNKMKMVLMNLATNARDAMPHGGDIIIHTEIVELGDEYIKTHGCGVAGKYVLLSFSDTGVGMDKEAKKRIFGRTLR